MTNLPPDYIESERQQRHIDSLVIRLLLSGNARELWSVEELAREIGDEITTIDSLERLRSAGLVHRLEGFVLATRAAARADELAHED